MPCWLKLGSITTVAIILNWAQRVENTTEYAHWLSLTQVILILLEACQNRLVRSKQETKNIIRLSLQKKTSHLGLKKSKPLSYISPKMMDSLRSHTRTAFAFLLHSQLVPSARAWACVFVLCILGLVVLLGRSLYSLESAVFIGQNTFQYLTSIPLITDRHE